MLETERDIVSRFLRAGAGEQVFDAGCGTGIFTRDILNAGGSVTGLDISSGMLRNAVENLGTAAFTAIQGDMLALPIENEIFDKSVSITAVEFIRDAKTAVSELFRVTRPGGTIVLATLNSLSPWAVRRQEKTIRGEGHILEDAFYRSPEDLLALVDTPGEYGTVVHFLNDDAPDVARKKEIEGKQRQLDTGAFVAVKWIKPR